MRTSWLLFGALTACADSAVVDNLPGQDTGGDTGQDTGTAPFDNSGEYVGTIAGLYEWQGNQATCEGEASFTLAADHTLQGTGNCVSDDWGTLEGDIVGRITDGAVDGTWTAYFNPVSVDQPLTGGVDEGHFEATTSYTNSFGSFHSTLTLDKQ